MTYSGYDILGRMTTETWVGTGARTITYGYDLDNRLTGVSDTDATLSYGYDALDRMTTATTTGIGGGQPTVTLTAVYDKIGNRTRLTDSLSASGTSGQGVTTYSYDLADRLTTIARTFGSSTGPRVTLAYDNADRLTSLTRKIGTTGTAVNSSYGYDGLDRLTAIDHAQVVGTTVTPRDAYAYGYDAADRLTTESASFGGLTKAITYAYDASNQLVAADRDGAATTADESYDYDANGNREMAGYATTTGNRISSSPGFTYSYDDEGNLKSKTETASGRVTTYAYDHRNRLTGATTKSGSTIKAQATFTYDAADRRIRTVLDADGTGGAAPVTTWTAYDGQNPYADFSGGGSLQTRYLHGPAVDWLLARTAAGGATAWYLTDRLGSVRDIASTAGTVLDHIDYDAYGRVTSESSPTNGDRFKFTGRELDNVTGLQYNRARYYDAAIGRWTQEDPIGFGGGDPNLHRYVGNAPTNGTDPSGLETRWWDYIPVAGIVFQGIGEHLRGRELDAQIAANERSRTNAIDSYSRINAIIDRPGMRGGSSVAMDGRPKEYIKQLERDANTARCVAVGAIAVGSLFIPGPEDLVVAAILSKNGLRVVTQAGRSRLFKGAREITEAEAKVLQAEIIVAKSRADAVARKFNLNPNGAASGQILSNLDSSVRNFVSKYRRGSILRELPGEVLNMTLEEALCHSTKVRKLLTVGKFAK